MLTQYHVEIMLVSVGDRFGPRAISEIIYANARQDSLNGQFGHDEFHCDNNAFEKAYAYVEEQRALVVASLQKKDALTAWQAFGRFLHTVQDFYAHSNYVTLWVSRFEGQALPAPTEIESMDPSLLNGPDLRSGKTYYPFELLYYWRPARAFALRWLPHDSHAWMNLDSPEQGFKFEYAMQAAIKRTAIEYNKTTSGFSDDMCKLFLGK